METLEIKKSKWFLFSYIMLGVVLLPLFLIGIFIILFGFLRYKVDKIEIRENQLYSRLGLLNIDIKTIPLDKISMVSVKTDIMSQLFNYGTIVVQSSAVNSTIIYPFIENPTEIVKEINKRIQIKD